jgi:hypothetical protein
VGKVHDLGMRAFFEVWFGLFWEKEQSAWAGDYEWVMTRVQYRMGWSVV